VIACSPKPGRFVTRFGKSLIAADGVVHTDDEVGQLSPRSANISRARMDGMAKSFRAVVRHGNWKHFSVRRRVGVSGPNDVNLFCLLRLCRSFHTYVYLVECRPLHLTCPMVPRAATVSSYHVWGRVSDHQIVAKSCRDQTGITVISKFTRVRCQQTSLLPSVDPLCRRISTTIQESVHPKIR
jgi:hypothetical protein